MQTLPPISCQAANNITTFLTTISQQLETFFKQILPQINDNTQANHKLYQAIRYAVLNGGKRLRPALVYATGLTLGITQLNKLDPIAASIELIHCYSLIHDDLPAMDNDDFRRGRPACHKAFSEATAILAGDALQSLAFELLSSNQLPQLPASVKLAMINVLAKAAGTQGMVLGQGEDLAAENQTISIEQLTTIHQHKTGALIKAAIELPMLAMQCTNLTKIKALLHYGECIGLAFQVYDDILEVTTNSVTLGKPTNSDQRNNKATFPGLLGLEQAQKYALSLHQEAIETLSIFSDNAPYLQKLANYFISRKY